MDPLQERFRDQEFTFANPVTKLKETLPLMEGLARKTNESYFQKDSSEFKILPPATLPNFKDAPGFPQTMQTATKDAAGSEAVDNEKEKENQNWLKVFKENFAEEEVVGKFISHFNKHPDSKGFMMHPYHSETFLNVLKDRAADQRRTLADLENLSPEHLPLSQLELDISECLGLGIKEIVGEMPLNESDQETYNMFFLKLANNATKEKKIIPTDFASFRKLPRKKARDNIDILNSIVYKHFLAEVQCTNREIDLIFALERQKAFVDVEIKSISTLQLSNALKKAAKQLKIENNKFINFHKDILTDGWCFTRVVAVPNIENKREKLKEENQANLVCDHCLGFILDASDLRDIDGWMQKLLDALSDGSGGVVDQNALRRLFTRLVGFSSISNSLGKSVSVSLADTRSEYEKAILGKDIGISSEKTLTGEDLSTCIDKLKLSNLKGQNLSSLDALAYWNTFQLEFLMKKPQRVWFDADFGCGKTLLMKYFATVLARHIAEDEALSGHSAEDGDQEDHEGEIKRTNVFFVSCAAARGQEVDELSWTRPAVLDVANLLDFKKTGVKVNNGVSMFINSEISYPPGTWDP